MLKVEALLELVAIKAIINGVQTQPYRNRYLLENQIWVLNFFKFYFFMGLSWFYLLDLGFYSLT